ncbi:unnamed protein product [Dibothriocephalus latus]|uniref:Uncharacterized protein n=1 Tax=Dibothriocephalus latus TaxID=60516 RepID=A0A3P6PIG4_DIBLA|nr:unnamed protein product [Dibothriocephalus latus]
MHCDVKQFTKIAPVAWMILLGDGFHNMMDGVTIGAGFSQSPILGLTLSLSIMFEELPHELGKLLCDFISIRSDFRPIFSYRRTSLAFSSKTRALHLKRFLLRHIVCVFDRRF